MTRKFYRCAICGRIVGELHEGKGPLICCGQPMAELVANTVDAAKEKHVPVVEQNGDMVTVKVGSVPHPMLEEHYIEWIYVATETGGHRRALKPGDEPQATFCIKGEKVVEVYEYCNLHGLWMTKL